MSVAVPLNLTDFKAPTAKVELVAGLTYTTTKGIDLGNAVWGRTGSGPDPIVKYTGPRDAAAFRSSPGNSPKVTNITVHGVPWTYAFEAQGGLDLNMVKVGGGAGVLKTSGATGLVKLYRVVQVERSTNYIVYIGPKVEQNDATNYAERWNQTVWIEECDFTKGSSEMAGLRAQAFKWLTIKKTHVSDTPAQSAVRADGKKAVTNAVLRIHYGGTAELSEDSFDGEIFLGPLDGNDGGKNLPAGPQRNYRATEKIDSLTFIGCVFDSPTFKLAPGAGNVKMLGGSILTTAATVLTAQPYPYMNRVRASMKLETVKTTSTAKDPVRLFDPKGGATINAVNTTLNGKAV